MKMFRLLLILAVIMSAWVVCLIVYTGWPYGLILPALLLIAAKHKGFFSSAYGTARWADADDLRQAGMLDAKEGLMLGRMECDAPTMQQGTRALFNRKLPARMPATCSSGHCAASPPRTWSGSAARFTSPPSRRRASVRACPW